MRSIRLSLALAALLGAGLLCAPSAHAEGKPIKVGVLKLTSSAPIFVGVEKGFFKEFGVEPELVYFQAAAPIARAAWCSAGWRSATGTPASRRRFPSAT